MKRAASMKAKSGSSKPGAGKKPSQKKALDSDAIERVRAALAEARAAIEEDDNITVDQAIHQAVAHHRPSDALQDEAPAEDLASGIETSDELESPSDVAQTDEVQPVIAASEGPVTDNEEGNMDEETLQAEESAFEDNVEQAEEEAKSFIEAEKADDVAENAGSDMPESSSEDATEGENAEAGEFTELSDATASEGAPDEQEEPQAEAAPDFSDLPPVLIAAAEAAPLAKTGGLADVVGALPKYLRKLGIDARIIMPFHRQIKERYRNETEHLFDYNAGPQWSSQFVGIDKLELDGTIYYFVDNEYYYGGEIYSGDNFEGEQYGFFVQAIVDALPNLDFQPGIVHCNDWHTALVPFKLNARAARENWWPYRTLLTIHNLAFQGTFGDDLKVRLIGGDEFNYARDLGVWNMMKAGIDTATRVNTVSPTYAWEITTPEFGEGLQGDLRYLMDQGRLTGILNGIDTDTWDPETDPHIAENFKTPIGGTGKRAGASLRKMVNAKRECKRALLEELGLDGDLDAPLFAMVGRLTPQKGVGLVRDIIDSLVPQGARFVILGSGYPDLEWQMRDCENRHHGRVCSYIGYNSDLSHRIYAGADFFLMPSAFEPCGISQMISMRYGTLPIVHETGGLKDTVTPYNQFTGDGCGFSFSRFDSWDAVDACNRALAAWWDKDIMLRLVQNAMKQDFGFDRCARSYAELYRAMMQ